MNIILTLAILLPGLFVNNKSSVQRRDYIIYAGIALILISGLRSIYIGTDDTSIYYSFFIRDSHRSFADIWQTEWKDPVYYIFIKFLSNFFKNDFNGILLVCGAIFVIPVCMLTRKESPDPFASFVVLVSMGFFFFSMNGIRQSMAMGFLMLSYFPLKERKLLLFIILVTLAGCFHKTALIFLIVYPLSFIGFNFKMICCYICLFLLALFYGDIFLNVITASMSKYDARLENYEIGRVTLTCSGLIQLVFLTSVSFFYRKKLLTIDKSNIILFHLMFIAIIFQTMSGQIAEMFRVAMYFSVFMIVLIPRTFAVIPASKRKSIKFVFLSLLLIYYFFWGAGTIPYMFYFQQS